MNMTSTNCAVCTWMTLSKMSFWISQGNVATSDSWGGQICKICIWNFLKFYVVKLLKLVNFWQLVIFPVLHYNILSLASPPTISCAGNNSDPGLRQSLCGPVCWSLAMNKRGFCTTFPVSWSSFTNTVPKWRNCSISIFFINLRLIVRFRFARQPTKIALLARICHSHVCLVCVRDKVAECNCTVACCDFIAR